MFIDTNILTSARVAQAPNHLTARERLNRALQEGELLRISRQVIREYLAVMTRPQTWEIPLTRDEILQDASSLLNAFDVLEDGPSVSEMLTTLCREVEVGGRQIHDTNIVATMLAHGERRLFTFNTSDFRRYGERIELVEFGSSLPA